MAVNRVSPKVGKVLALPESTVTIGSATSATSTTASVSFTATTSNLGGPTISYLATSSPGSITGRASTSPITVSGLTTGTAYTFTVVGSNPSGNSTAGPSAASNSVTPQSPTKFESIASATGTGSSGTISFSSIPGTYKHLQLRINARCNSGAITDCYIRFNSDTGSNYAKHWMFGLDSGGPYVSTAANTTPFSIGYVQGYDTYPTTGAVIDIHDYANTAINKTTRYLVGTPEQQTTSQGAIVIGSGLWMNTNAITSIDIVLASSSFSSSSTFALYGIKG